MGNPVQATLIRVRIALLLACTTACTARAAPRRPEPVLVDVEEVLGKVRRAVGYERLAARTDHIQVTGRMTMEGVSEDSIVEFAPHGHTGVYRLSGPLRLERTFDGRDAWAIYDDGPMLPADLGERDATLLGLSLSSESWLAPRTCKQARLTATGEIDISCRIPMGTGDFHVQVDPKSSLPVRAIWDAAPFGDTRELGDYRPVLGFLYPHRIGSTVVSDVRAVEPTALPTAPVLGRTELDRAAPAELECRRLDSSGVLLVRVTLNDRPGWCVLDSGAGGFVFTHAFAKAAGTDRVARLQEPTGIELHRANRVRIGPLTISKPLLSVEELSGVDKRIGAVGLCGADVFAASIVELDVRAGRAAIYDPATFVLPGVWRPLRFQSRQPFLDARFEGHAGIFMVDTGSDNLLFNYPAVERLHLLQHRAARSMSIQVGADSLRVASGTLRSFELEAATFHGFPVAFAVESRGAAADRYSDGAIGAPLLEPFRVYFDYPHRRIALLLHEN